MLTMMMMMRMLRMMMTMTMMMTKLFFTIRHLAKWSLKTNNSDDDYADNGDADNE